MALTRGKIIKANNEEPDEVEKAISQALLDLEVNSDWGLQYDYLSPIGGISLTLAPLQGLCKNQKWTLLFPLKSLCTHILSTIDGQ